MNTPALSETSSLAGKYLTISLADESYGIAVLKVREIIRCTQITPVPQLPSYVRGVINLRGRVIPIIDLRLKFQLPTATTDRSCIVVVEVDRGGGKLMPMGVIVDAVEEVANVLAGEIEPTPDLGGVVDTSYLIGVAKVKGQVKLLLDIDRVIATEALTVISKAA
ncbi:MAG: chemotaxis protein CheW [Nibricoccus sp.]